MHDMAGKVWHTHLPIVHTQNSIYLGMFKMQSQEMEGTLSPKTSTVLTKTPLHPHKLSISRKRKLTGLDSPIQNPTP